MSTNNLKFLREETGFSLYTLEEFTHLSASLLSLLENGKRPFRESHINILCPFFDVTSDFLLGKSQDGIGIYSSETNNATHVFVSYIFYRDLLTKNVGRYRFVRLDEDGPVNVNRAFEFTSQHPDSKYAIRRYFSAQQDHLENEKRKKLISETYKIIKQLDDVSIEMIKDLATSFLKEFGERRKR